MQEPLKHDGPAYGTPEFHRKHRGRPVPTEDAGEFAILVDEECLLDTLRNAGRLGEGDDLTRRFSAGIWLRALFDRAGLRDKVGMSFEPPVQGKGEMTDAQAWNRRCWNETMREMGVYAFLLLRVCVFDELPHSYSLRHLERALDRLADHRGL